MERKSNQLTFAKQVFAIFLLELMINQNQSLFLLKIIFLMKKLQVLCLVFSILLSFRASSQEIKGDVLWVNTFTPATIRFPDNITSAEAGCSEGLYQITKTDNKLVINPVAEKKPPSCVISVEEGGRQHTFKVFFQDNDADIDLDKSYLDLHTLDLLQQRVAQVKAKQKDKPTMAPTPTVAKTETVGPPPPAPAPPPPPAPAAAPQAAPAPEGDYIAFDGRKIFRSQLNDIVIGKIKKVNKNLEALGSQSSSAALKKQATANIMAFFNNKTTVLVEVRNKNKPPFKKPITQYLNDFSRLPYSKVKIEDAELTFVGNFVKNEDGSYHGVVVLQQRFIGYNREGGVQYSDVTKKDVEIDVRFTEQVKDGEVKQLIDVFLGNISVSSES